MLESRNTFCCDQPQALVMIEVLPLCFLDTEEGASAAFSLAQALASQERGSADPTGMPLRCVAAMPCVDALALAKEAGHVLL